MRHLDGRHAAITPIRGRLLQVQAHEQVLDVRAHVAGVFAGEPLRLQVGWVIRQACMRTRSVGRAHKRSITWHLWRAAGVLRWQQKLKGAHEVGSAY